TMKRLHWMAAGAILVLSAGAPSLRAAITCSTSDYVGSYSFRTLGTFVTLPPAAALLMGGFAQAGTFTSDGQGNVTIESTASYNGLIQPANDPATYVINPDCTITFSLILPPPLGIPSTFQGVLSSDLREMSLTITDPPGTVVIGTHAKQDLRFCGVADFTGAYAIDMQGVVSQPKNLAGQFQRIGRVVSDGAGNFTASTIANYAGVTTTENLTGTYDLNAKCVLTMNYSTGGGASAQSGSLSGTLGGHGDIAMMLVTTPGWAVSGTLKSQQR
ncbi:MAG TPA: hypothetical protein VGF36_04505, partial [Rhodopila sp.]